MRGPQSALFGANAIGSVVRIVSRRGGPPSGLFQVEAGSYDTSRVAGSTAGSHAGLRMGRLLRSTADRRHERREHRRRRDRRQRRLHAAIVRGLARVAQQRVVAARRRAACGRRARLSRSVRQQSGRQLRAGSIWCRVARIRERRRASPGRRCSPRASGCRHRRTTTKSRATSSARSTSRKAIRAAGRAGSSRTSPFSRDWMSRRAWSSSVSGPAAPTSPATTGRRFPIVRGIEGYFVEGAVGLAGTAVPDGGSAGRSDPARRHRSHRRCPRFAVRRCRPIRSCRPTRGSPGPGWLAPRAPTTHAFAAPSARASGRPTASSCRSPTTPA